jgi:hypothetical protein
VAGPGFIYLVGGALVAGVLLFVGVVFVEAVVLTLFKWSRFWRALLASFVMNLITTAVGLVVAGLVVTTGAPAWLLLTFVMSVVLEGVVVAVMDRAKVRQGLVACLVANIVTYVPLGGILLATGTLF